MMEQPHELEDRLIDFAVRIINVIDALPNTKVGNHIGGQLLRSGTSPAPNYGEAQSAECPKGRAADPGTASRTRRWPLAPRCEYSPALASRRWSVRLLAIWRVQCCCACFVRF